MPDVSDNEASEKASMGNVSDRESFIKPSTNRFDLSLAKMVMMDGLSFNLVEKSAFQNFMQTLQPLCSLPSKLTLARQCLILYHHEKQKMIASFENFHGHVSITMSSWIDVSTLNYVCLTAHYIDHDWKIRRRIISFILTPLTEPDFSESILSRLAEWKLEKLFSISLDNTIAMKLPHLQLKNNIHPLLKSATDLLYVPCHAHIFKLLAREGLNPINCSFQRIRRAIIHVQRSEAVSEFYKIAKDMDIETKRRLYVDFPDLWHSKYLMLENTLRYKEVFIQFRSFDPDFKKLPTADDWNKVRVVCNFLKVYYEAAKLFSESGTTADIFLLESCKIYVNLSRESKSSDPFISSMATRMLTKLTKHLNVCYVFLAIPMVLNPQYKLQMVEFCLQKLYGDYGSAASHVARVRVGIQKLYDEYDSTSFSDMEASNVHHINRDDDKDNDIFMQGYEEFLEKRHLTQSPKSELEQYLEEKVHSWKDKEFNTLNYWKLNEHRFPKLARLARDVLVLPVFTLASQSIFQTGRRVLDEKITRMGFSILEKRICMQNWLHEGSDSSPVAAHLHCPMLFGENDYCAKAAHPDCPMLFGENDYCESDEDADMEEEEEEEDDDDDDGEGEGEDEDEDELMAWDEN